MGAEETEDPDPSKSDRARQAFLRKVILSGTFVAPAVASFAMGGAGAEQADRANAPAFPGCPDQANCFERTVAYIEHPETQYFPYYMFLDYLKVIQEYHHLPPAGGPQAIAKQWCSYARPIPITPPPAADRAGG